MEDFKFIADEQYRELLKRDFIELRNCLENKASKSVLILSGSIIETILLEFFSHNLPKGVTKTQLLKKNLGDLIDYIRVLKKEVDQKELFLFCKRLLKEVEKGKKQNIYVLFGIFGDDLNVLPEDEKELILTYIYNKVSYVSLWGNEIESSRIRLLFSYLGHYLYSPEIKQKFFDLLINLVRCHFTTKNSKWYYTTTYMEMIDVFPESERRKCDNYIKENVSTEEHELFFKELEDDLPF